MACDSMRTRRNQTQAERLTEIDETVRELEKLLQQGLVQVVVSDQGAIAFRGWDSNQRNGVGDVCAYQRLQVLGSWELQQAVAAAEALSGNQVNQQVIGAGVHSHDGGHSWGGH